MRVTLLAALGAAALSALCGAALADDKDDITRLIPAATAMQRDDFVKLASGVAAPREEDVAEKSLTLKILAMPLERDEKQEVEFSFGDELPRPSDLAREFARTGPFNIPLGPVTAVHANRIREVTCEVDGEQAHGVVKYEVPKLYRGQFEYVASKKDGQWQIVELAMPAHKWHTVRGEDGKWKLKE